MEMDMDMMISLLILLATYLIIWFFTYLIIWFFRRPYAGKLPPGPRGLPFIGNLLQLGKQPHQTMAKFAQQYGPLISLRFGFQTIIVVSSPDMAKEVLRKNDKLFLNRVVPDAVAAQPNPEATIGWADADHWWTSRRRIMNTNLFTSQRLDTAQDLLHKKVGDLIHYLNRHCASDSTPVDIGQLVFATNLNLISNTIFSLDVIDSDFRSAQEFKNLVTTIMEEAAKPNISDYFPILSGFDLQGMRKRIKPCYTRLHQIFDNIIDKRLQSRTLGLISGDFLDVLIDQFGNNESIFDRVNIKPLIVDLFLAGSDTTAVTTEWAMTELLRNPEILHNLQNEIEQKIGGQGVGKEISDIDQLPYLHAVIRETLRLHPAVPLLLPHKAKDNTKICDFSINKGSQVLVNQWAIGRNPMYWESPLSFEPARFLEPNCVDYKGQDFEFIPFGAGRRICPGLPLAIRMIRLILASLVHNFDWKFPEGVTAENIDMEEQFGVTMKKATPLLIVPSNRKC